MVSELCVNWKSNFSVVHRWLTYSMLQSWNRQTLLRWLTCRPAVALSFQHFQSKRNEPLHINMHTIMYIYIYIYTTSRPPDRFLPPTLQRNRLPKTTPCSPFIQTCLRRTVERALSLALNWDCDAIPFCDRSYYRGHNSNNDSGCAVLRMRDRIHKERRLNLGPPALRMVLPRTHDINQLVEHRMDEYGVFWLLIYSGGGILMLWKAQLFSLNEVNAFFVSTPFFSGALLRKIACPVIVALAETEGERKSRPKVARTGNFLCSSAIWEQNSLRN